jgi:hypothetical protein
MRWAGRGVVSCGVGGTGLEVVEVNIAVGDVHLPDEEDDEETAGRVQ